VTIFVIQKNDNVFYDYDKMKLTEKSNILISLANTILLANQKNKIHIVIIIKYLFNCVKHDFYLLAIKEK